MGIFSFVKPGKQIFKTIKSVKPAKNLTTKRKIQDETVKAVDEGIKKADVPQSFRESQKIKQYASEMKRKKSKELKDYSYRLDKLTEKKPKKEKRFYTGKELEQQDYFNKGKGREKKMGGGMMGRRFGMKSGRPFKKETNVEKIKKAFPVAKKGLKKIDPQKQKGLAKLKKARPDVVRKMGYFKRGGRS